MNQDLKILLGKRELQFLLKLEMLGKSQNFFDQIHNDPNSWDLINEIPFDDLIPRIESLEDGPVEEKPRDSNVKQSK